MFKLYYFYKSQVTSSPLWLFYLSMMRWSSLSHSYTKTETCKLYSRVFWIFLPNVIKIDPYNFELYRFKVGAFLRHSVYVSDCQLEPACKDPLCWAPMPPSMVRKIFAVLDVWDHYVVLTLSFKLISFLHLYLLFYGREHEEAATSDYSDNV